MSKVSYTATTLAILQTLAQDPEKRLHTRKVAEKAKVSVGAASMILRELEGSHLLEMEEMGGMKVYRLNLDNPVAREFKILFNVSGLNDLVASLKESADKIILFGSASEGTDTGESDLDLFILTSEPKTARIALRGFREHSSGSLAPIIATPVEWARLRRRDRPLYESISRGKVLWERT